MVEENGHTSDTPPEGYDPQADGAAPSLDGHAKRAGQLDPFNIRESQGSPNPLAELFYFPFFANQWMVRADLAEEEVTALVNMLQEDMAIDEGYVDYTTLNWMAAGLRCSIDGQRIKDYLAAMGAQRQWSLAMAGGQPNAADRFFDGTRNPPGTKGQGHAYGQTG